MRNVRISLPLVNGGLMPLDFETTKDVVLQLAGDDVRPPPRSLVIEAQAEDGRVVTISFPFDRSHEASVRIAERDEAAMPYEPGDKVQNHTTNEVGTVKSCDFNGPVLVQTTRGTTVQWNLDDVGRA